MFTIKHRESPALGGGEFLYSAETIEVVRKGDHFEDGIFLDREMQPRAPDEPPFFTSKHIILFGGDETIDRVERKGGKVWVMNEQGSTVATYDL